MSGCEDLPDSYVRGLVRLDYVLDPGPCSERITFVWDRTKVLVHDADGTPAYTLYEASDEHRDDVDIVHSSWYDLTAPEFAKACPSSGRSGSRHGDSPAGHDVLG